MESCERMTGSETCVERPHLALLITTLGSGSTNHALDVHSPN